MTIPVFIPPCLVMVAIGGSPKQMRYYAPVEFNDIIACVKARLLPNRTAWILPRQAGTCDPLHTACTWTHLSSSSKDTKKQRGTKNTCMQLGQTLDRTIRRRKKKQNAQLPFLESPEQQLTTHAPYTQHHKGLGTPPRPPLAAPGTSKGGSGLLLPPAAGAGAPVKSGPSQFIVPASYHSFSLQP